MRVTAYELKTRCGELIERAAEGEEIVITKRGVVKARMVPAEHFDPREQARVLENMARIRRELAREGKRVTRAQIRKAVAEGRR